MNLWDVESIKGKKVEDQGYTHCVFIHIPKNGGTSVRKYFGELDWCIENQTNAHGRIVGLPQELVNSSYFWALFRDPYKRAESIYHHMMHFNKVGLEFNDFWAQVFKAGTQLNLQFHDPTNVVLKPQSWWFHPKLHLFQFHDIEQACKSVANRFKLETLEEFPHENNNPKGPIEWQDVTLRRIEMLYAADVMFFNNIPGAKK